MAADILGFMESPLITWVRTFNQGGGAPMDFQDLCDGAYLNDVLCNIDQRDLDSLEVKRSARDNNARLQNWGLLVRNIRTYYQEILHQLVVMELPDVVALVKDPTKESSLTEMRKVLLLLLGCAVQCHRKEYFISIITQMDIDVQQDIVSYIRQITDSKDNVYNLATEGDDDVKQFTKVLRGVVQERDKYSEMVQQVCQERDYYRRELERQGVVLTPPPHLEKYHLMKDLADNRNKLHLLNEELEEKLKLVSDMKEELDTTKSSLSKLKYENLSLSKDAKSARGYRDELDVVNEKMLNVAKYEKEIQKLKEKLNETDFYKSRVEELREDNSALLEVKVKLEEQQETVRRKQEGMLEELLRLQTQLEHTQQEREECQTRMKQLVEENATLEFERTSLKESYECGGRSMRRIYSCSSVDLNGSQLQLAGHPISEELSDTMTSQVTRLEMDNEEMKQELDEARLRLADTQRHLEQVKGQLERDYQQRVAQMETETSELRRRTSRELSKEFKNKVTEIEEKSMKLKKRVSGEYVPKINSLEKANQDLQKQLKLAQANWEKEQERFAKLDATTKQLAEEREQFKEKVRTIQRSSACRIEELERQVTAAQDRTSDLHRSSNRISYVSSEEMKEKNGHMMPHSNGHMTPQSSGHVTHAPSSDKKHKRKGSDSSMHSYHGFPTHSDGHTTSASRHSDILRKKPGRRKELESPVPERPHSVLGVSHDRHRSPPVHGVVTPQRRSEAPSLSFNPFKRKDKMRSTMSQQARPVQVAAPFMRNDPIRASMPERKAAYVTPERRQPPPQSPVSTPGDRSKTYTTSTGFSKHPSKPCPTDVNRNVLPQDRSRGYSSDSGCATSPDSPCDDLGVKDDNNGHLLTSFQVISSETIRTQLKSSSMPSDGKWRLLVEKIVDLQDKNQALVSQNSELRRDMNAVKFTVERLEHLEKKNIQLEIENKKLKQIIESIYGPGGLYDSREYQFSSNV